MIDGGKSQFGDDACSSVCDSRINSRLREQVKQVYLVVYCA